MTANNETRASIITKPDGLEQLAAYRSAVYAQNPENWYTVEETRAMYVPKQ